jgi:hypothetical protein
MGDDWSSWRASSDIGSLLIKKRCDAGCSQADRNRQQNFRQTDLHEELSLLIQNLERGFEPSETGSGTVQRR